MMMMGQHQQHQSLFRRLLLSEGESSVEEEVNVEMEMYGSSEIGVMTEESMGSEHFEEHEEHAEDGTNSSTSSHSFSSFLVCVCVCVCVHGSNQIERANEQSMGWCIFE